MSIVEYRPQGDIGMLAVEDAVLNGLGWIFRRQQSADVGIDAHIEVVVRGEATGRLIGVQVKSGPSFFREADGDRIVFRADEPHADYWRRHCLPVIVALHDTSSGAIYWQKLDDSTIVSTGVGRRVDVPRSQVLGRNAARALIDLTTETPYDQKIAALGFSRPDVEMLFDGKTHRWVHELKSYIAQLTTTRDEGELFALLDAFVNARWAEAERWLALPNERLRYSLWLAYGNDRRLEFAFGNADVAQREDYFEFGEGIAGMAFADPTRAPFNAVHPTRHPSWKPLTSESSAQAMLVVPVGSGDDRPLGVLSVTRKRSEKFDPDAVQLLSMLGSVIGTAIGLTERHAITVEASLLPQPTTQ